MTEIIVQLLSVVGAGLILLAYGLAPRASWQPAGARSASVNLVGASLLAAVAVYERQLGFILLEGTWIAIAMLRLVRWRTR